MSNITKFNKLMALLKAIFPWLNSRQSNVVVTLVTSAASASADVPAQPQSGTSREDRAPEAGSNSSFSMRPASLSWAIVSCLLASVIMMSGATPIPTSTPTSSNNGVQSIPHCNTTTPDPLFALAEEDYPKTIQGLLSKFNDGDLKCLREHGAESMAVEMGKFLGPEKSQQWDGKDKYQPLVWLVATKLVEAVKENKEQDITLYASRMGNDFCVKDFLGLKKWAEERRGKGL
ncbi:hypothetical protein H0H93_003573 [Arthromyces matolae]|nr:hypothetical protein H0H93_003573 [Arthromyces matolae]